MLLRVYFFVFFVLYSSGVRCFEHTSEETYNEETPRALKDDFGQNQWRAVEVPQERGGWIPSDQTSEDNSEPPLPLKRRRIRKRKRRPILSSLSEDGPEAFDGRPRRRRPQRLDEFSSDWREMELESAVRPYHRRRVSPVYRPLDEIISGESVSASIRFGNAEGTSHGEVPQETQVQVEEIFEEQQETTTTTTNVPDLKSLLKKTGSVSLSEILQQKNLTLSDLIRGKSNAISALTERPAREETVDYSGQTEEPTTTRPPKYGGGYRKMPSLNALRKQINRDQDRATRTESPQVKQTTLQENKESSTKIYYDSSEESTERRIFVPSHPKYYTSFNYRPQIDDDSPFFWPTASRASSTSGTLPTTTTTQTPTTVTTITTTTSTTTTTQPESTTSTTPPPTKLQEETTTSKIIVPNLKNRLPVTSAKIYKPVKSAETVSESYPKVSILPENAFKINIKQLFGLSEVLKANEQKPPESTTSKFEENTIKQNDKKEDESFNSEESDGKEQGPFKMTIDLDESVKQSNIAILKPPNYKEEATEGNIFEISTTLRPIQEKLGNVTAKEEILEILKDKESKERLSRILMSRNMTLQELVEQRERGSSQRHLADIFHNNTREPEPKLEEVFEGKIKNEVIFQNFPVFRKPKSNLEFSTPETTTKKLETPPPTIGTTDYKHTDVTENVFQVTRVSIKPLEGDFIEETQKPREAYSVTSFPTYKIELDKGSKTHPFQIPIWKTIYPSVYSDVYEDNHKKSEELNEFQGQIFRNEISRIDNIENTIADAVNEQLNVDIDENQLKVDEEEEEEGYFNLPTGVKSAVLASLVIVGSSLLIFLTILVIFRWSQKTKKRFCYRSGFSASKIKSPILEEGPRRAIKTFMTETLGRKKMYDKGKQSMTDTFWETDRKPFQ